MVVKHKDDNLNLYELIKRSLRKIKRKVNQSQSGNSNEKGNTKGNKYRQISPQNKWKLESPKDGYA